MNHQRISRELLQKKDQIASKALKLIYKNQPLLKKKFQNSDNSKSLRDLKYHLDYLAEAVQNNSPELFIDYIDWVRIILNNIGMNDTDIKENFANLQKAVREELATTELDDFFQMAVKRLKHPAHMPTSFLYKDNPLRKIANKYLSYLLQGNRQQASQLILQAVEQGESVKDIYLEVFEPVQKEIGRLWQLNEINVAQEHFASAVTQFIMAQLYPKIFFGVRTDKKLIAASMGNELHEIGIRMVSDFFEMEGWNTYYLGANVPQKSLLEEIKNKKPHVVAISATISFNLNQIAGLINAIRQIDDKVKIMVGGYPFLIDKKLWQKVGADGTAKNAQDALQIAESLVA